MNSIYQRQSIFITCTMFICRTTSINEISVAYGVFNVQNMRDLFTHNICKLSSVAKPSPSTQVIYE